MALQKAIRQNDGITTNYHRILYLDLMVNSHNSIAVVSYLDKEAREDEASGGNPYKQSITYELDYVEGMTIESAYEWLKTNRSEFYGAEDI